MQPVHTIKKIEYFVQSNRDVLRDSVFPEYTEGITISELYDNQQPKRDGLIDPRMGTTQQGIVCATCGLNEKYCPGHFGHIQLTTSMFHIGYLPYVVKTLNCICPHCSKLRFLKSKLRGKKIHSLTDSLIFSKDEKECWNCGLRFPRFKSDDQFNVFIELTKETDSETNIQKTTSQIFTPDRILTLFKNITMEDSMILGFSQDSRPEGMLIESFPVAPIVMRPSVKVPGVSFTRDDDLTKLLATIVKNNRRIKDAQQQANTNTNISVEDNLKEYLKNLQYAIGEYYDSDITQTPMDRMKNIKGLLQRIEGKMGIIRGHLMGKRVDYCGRSVITADANLKVNEIGIPIKIARTLTYPEIVDQNNIAELTQRVINGKKTYPGANYLIRRRKDGTYSRPIDLSVGVDRASVHIEIGDIVERQLVNGDVVLFNRQPSLHKYSMMAFYVVVLEDPSFASFRTNVGVSTPFNFDYDGRPLSI